MLDSYMPENIWMLAKPTVLKIATSAGIRYMVAGTAYGYLHTSGGDIRTWATYSGAYKAAKKYQAGV